MIIIYQSQARDFLKGRMMDLTLPLPRNHDVLGFFYFRTYKIFRVYKGVVKIEKLSTVIREVNMAEEFLDFLIFMYSTNTFF